MFQVAGVRVWSLKSDRGSIPADAVYVGRPTTYGNPYSHLKGEGVIRAKSRANAVEMFEEYTKRNLFIATRAPKDLKGKDLVCWCEDEPCHAAVIARLANGVQEPAKVEKKSRRKP